MTAVPLAGPFSPVPTPLTLRAISPSAVSLASTLISLAVPSSVVSMSSLATGGSFVTVVTSVTVTVTGSVPVMALSPAVIVAFTVIA